MMSTNHKLLSTSETRIIEKFSVSLDMLFNLMFFPGGYIGIIGAVLVDIAGLANLEVATGIFIATLGVSNILLHSIAGMLHFV